MAGRLIDLDPELAFQHALAASRRGGRLAAVREAVGLTAYAAGHYGEALREFRTFRRISGSNVHLPVMADCERGLGRPDRALDLARSDEAASLDAAGAVELAMVVSGARSDLGQKDAAVAALEIPQLDLHRAFSYSPRLFRAYADALDAAGRQGESGRWRRQADVAEKALGIDEDTEPDIIDLVDNGEDEQEPLPVPTVTDVLQAKGGSRGVVRDDAGTDGRDSAAVASEGEGQKADVQVADIAPVVEADVDQTVVGPVGEGMLLDDVSAEPEASSEVTGEQVPAAVEPPQTEMLFDLEDPESIDPEPEVEHTSTGDEWTERSTAPQSSMGAAPTQHQDDVE